MLFNAAFVAAAAVAALTVPPSGVSVPVVTAMAVSYAAMALYWGAVTRRSAVAQESPATAG
jgi:NAD/NADP transhydrogenase alpha subunit